MDQSLYSCVIPLQQISITDDFWGEEMELVRREVIPYQWEALNDRVEGASPSYSMRNFKTAAEINKRGKNKEDKFYGFVFQDSDLYKWIEAAAYSLVWHPDSELERTVDGAIDVVCAAAADDGYLDTYYIINGREGAFTDLRNNHELYCFGHLTEAAVAYFQATGKDRLLSTARKYADYIISLFGPQEGKRKGYPGHEIAEMALVRLFEVTGEEKYLQLGKYFIDERGKRPYYFDGEHPGDIKPGEENELRYQYNQAHLPVREQDEAVGHAVRAVYLYSGMTDVARLTGDESLWNACCRLWKSVTEEKMYITGGIGATAHGEAFSYPYDLPNDTAYSETCAAIGLVFWARRMLEVKPDSRYADVMERALCNGVLCGMALDGKSFFYVNPLEVDPKACKNDPGKAHVMPVRQKWFGCACCPPNLARLLSSIGSYAYTASADTLYVHLYIGSNTSLNVGGKNVSIRMESGFPYEGRVSIRVRAKESGLRLAFRIPGWCDTYEMTEKGDNLCARKSDGYLYISGDWGEEDCFEFTFPMRVRLTAADTRVREDIGKAAIVRGPIVYCLEEADNGSDLHLISLSERAPESAIVCDDSIDGVSFKSIKMPGYRQERDEHGTLYHEWRPQKREETMLKFIPYYMWGNRGENEMQVWTRISE